MAIVVIDGSSGCELVEVEVSKGAFADALFGLHGVPCQFEYSPECPVGKVQEVKSEVVFVPDHAYKNRDAVARAAVAPLEVDGWQGYSPDATNHHNRVPREAKGGSYYRVTFVRFVDAPAGRE